MSIDWNFGDQKPMECKSTFTKDADRAFDEFCKLYLNGSSNLLASSTNAEPTRLSNNQITEFNDGTRIQINTTRSGGELPATESTEDRTSPRMTDTKALQQDEEAKMAVPEDKKDTEEPALYTTIYDDTNQRYPQTDSVCEDKEEDREYSFDDVLEAYNRGCRSQDNCTATNSEDAEAEALRNKLLALRDLQVPSRRGNTTDATDKFLNRLSEYVHQDQRPLIYSQPEENNSSVSELFYPPAPVVQQKQQNSRVAQHARKSRMSRKMRTERARSLYNSIGSNSIQQAGHVDYEMFTSELDRYLEKLKVAQRELELKLSSVKSSMVLEEDSNSLFSDTFEANGVADTSFEPVDDEESTCELKSDQYDKMRFSKSQTLENEFDCSTSCEPSRLTPEEVYIATTCPKKTSFYDEFSSHKNQHNMSKHVENELQKFAAHSSSPSADLDSECDARTEREEASSVPSWLSLKVIACGMRKYAQLPIPAVNFFIDKGDFGDDAGFWAEAQEGSACGIADGATGNSQYGYDPGDFSRNLMEQCSELFSTKPAEITDARDLLLKAYDVVQDKTCYGSCTSCVISLDHTTGVLSAVNIGDSGYCVMRDGAIVHASEPDRLSFECPKQLDSYPWKQESRRMGISYTDILGSDTMCDQIEVLKDDVIIISSDGLYDNLDLEEIEQIFHKSKTQMDAAEKLVYNSVKFYRKPDDILVLIAVVVEKTTINARQIFTKDPSV